jgi:hypothetical protein
VRRREIPPLERDTFHPRNDLLRRQPGFDDERLDRRLQETRRLLRHSATLYRLSLIVRRRA